MKKEDLKKQSILQTLNIPTSLQSTLNKLGFVQADPIRSPARAQDLILRHRVTDYKIDDLEKSYPNLDIEEDYLYAYGFVTKEVRKLLYPRTINKLTDFDFKVLEVIKEVEEVHPKDLEIHFGSQKERNGWGGTSKSTTRSLDRLHHHGHVRISRREKGIRVYSHIKETDMEIDIEERMEKIVNSVIKLLAPVPLKTLNQALSLTRYFVGQTKDTVLNLLKKGEIREDVIDGIKYLSPADLKITIKKEGMVRFLAPFDPIVWDRIRFEHLWGWPYRFEAYTPKSKRVRGYYSLPLLWNYNVIGWVNLKIVNSELDVELGFVNGRPNDIEFKRSLDEEISSFKKFLRL